MSRIGLNTLTLVQDSEVYGHVMHRDAVTHQRNGLYQVVFTSYGLAGRAMSPAEGLSRLRTHGSLRNDVGTLDWWRTIS